MKMSTVTLIDEGDFSELVRETYGKPYQFQQQEFLSQDSIRFFTVPEEPDNYGLTLAEWVATPVVDEMSFYRDCYPELQMIVNDLHERELLPAGRYALHIWW